MHNGQWFVWHYHVVDHLRYHLHRSQSYHQVCLAKQKLTPINIIILLPLQYSMHHSHLHCTIYYVPDYLIYHCHLVHYVQIQKGVRVFGVEVNDTAVVPWCWAHMNAYPSNTSPSVHTYTPHQVNHVTANHRAPSHFNHNQRVIQAPHTDYQRNECGAITHYGYHVILLHRYGRDSNCYCA